MSVLEYLSDSLSLDSKELLSYISTCPHRYKVYKIPKRKGIKFRTIAQPARELKFFQKEIQNKFLLNLPVHDACKSYIAGKNIKDNALVHVGSRYLLKMDFKDFFPSITPSDLIMHLDKYSDNEFSSEDKTILSKILFYSKRGESLRLSIGAPVSPFISNTIMYDFDVLIAEACNAENIKYTRYADDISFSTNKKNILFSFEGKVRDILETCSYPRISINDEKTVFLCRKDNMHVTGLVLTNDGKVSIGREKKRHIKSLVFKCIKNQIESKEKSYLKGYISYCCSVDPEFILSLKRKYGEDVIMKINAI